MEAILASIAGGMAIMTVAFGLAFLIQKFMKARKMNSSPVYESVNTYESPGLSYEPKTTVS